MALTKEYQKAPLANGVPPPATSEEGTAANGQVVNVPTTRYTNLFNFICFYSNENKSDEEKNNSDDDEDMPIIKKFCFQRPTTNPVEMLREKLKKQSEIMWDMREKLQRNKLSKKDLVALLEYNSQMNDIMRKKSEDQVSKK